MNDIDRIQAALRFIDAHDRDTWLRMGMAVKSELGDSGFRIWDTWSRTADNYNARDACTVWKSIHQDGGITIATLFHKAKECGWRDDGAEKPQEPRKAKAAPNPKGNPAALVWARCSPVTSHPYIEAKQGVADGLRVVPDDDPLTIAGYSVAGWLVVPAYGSNGELQSLQFIPPPGLGKKLNLPGAPMAGASFTVGTLDPDGQVYVVEGIGQAWACWKATGRAAVVAFGWHNVARIAASLQGHHVVIVPDRGKEAAAEKIARDLGCAVAYLPQDEPDNFDANDYALREGFDALEQLLSQAKEPPKPEPLLKPVSVEDVLTNPPPPPEFVWEGYVPRGEVTLFGAHGGTGKSTIALMLAVAVATGRPLFGVGTIAAPALFVSLEDGAAIMRHRLAKICKAWGIDPNALAGRLHIVDGTANPELFTADSRNAGAVTATYLELSARVANIGAGLVVVDNASDAFGGDEINRRQVRGFMRALTQLARLNHCAVLVLAHVDKTTSRSRKAEGGEGYSGSTAWHNSSRSRLFMARHESGLLTLEHQKSNLGKRREPLTLTWPDGSLPIPTSGAPNLDGQTAQADARADELAAAALLAMIAEFEARGQYASPSLQARNNVHALLRAEPEFQRLKLGRDDTARIVNQCQRAGLLGIAEYRTPDRKIRERWTVTDKGRDFAGLPAPTAPTAPTYSSSAQGAQGACGRAHRAHTLGGYGGRARAHVGANDGAEVLS